MFGIRLDRTSELPLWRQIWLALRDAMMQGNLAAGETLPSSRELASTLGVSRNTVCEAYDTLLAEGYATSRAGARLRIAEGLRLPQTLAGPNTLPSSQTPAGPNTLPLHPVPPTPGLPVDKLSPTSTPPPLLLADFATGRPDLRCFPRYLWQQTLTRATAELPMNRFGYTGPKGDSRLCKEISAWLFRSRGLSVDPGNIYITAGATHALHLVADLLCDTRKGVLMEDPCHTGMLEVFTRRNIPVVPVPVDSSGLVTSELPLLPTAKLLYLTPSHQFPLGGILPAARRVEILRYAAQHDLHVVEDDYDSEFRHAGEALAPLHAMAPERVIYVGTFSKSLFPALRIGYAILPKSLQAEWCRLRTHADVQNPPFEQAALADLLAAGKFDRHVRTMRRLYGERRSVLLTSLREHFGSDWVAIGDAAGLHLAVQFPGRLFDPAFSREAHKAGIRVTPVESHSIEKGSHPDMLLLGYGHLEPDEIRAGIRLLWQFMQEKGMLARQ